MNYFSDLDLIFCWDESAPGLDPARAGEIALRVTEMLTRSTPEGGVYTIDARLRPEGANAPLAPPLSRYAQYYAERAEPWEFQSAMKLRTVAGDRAVGARLIQTLAGTIRERLRTLGRREELAGPMRRMRERIEQNAKTPKWVMWDFKKGYGGVIDLEFLAQFLQLIELSEDAAEPASTAMIGLRPDEVFARGAERGAIAPEMAAALREDYVFLRKLESRARLLLETERSHIPGGGEKWTALARAVGDLFPGTPDALREHLLALQQRNRKRFVELLR
jgi:glutamate-ammonia-ligase adenylyltransferase